MFPYTHMLIFLLPSPHPLPHHFHNGSFNTHTHTLTRSHPLTPLSLPFFFLSLSSTLSFLTLRHCLLSLTLSPLSLLSLSLLPLSPLTLSLPSLSLLPLSLQQSDLCLVNEECARCAKDLQSEGTDCNMPGGQTCNAELFDDNDDNEEKGKLTHYNPNITV